MQKNEKSSIKRIIGLCLILILLSGVGVMAVATQINSVEIKLADGYTITSLTTKTKVSEILEDNNIILENGERVYPSLDESITENKKITIINKNEQEIEIAKISESGIETTLETLLNGYNIIVEKIVKEQQAIPYETITKDISSGSSNTKNRVLQEGQDGIKEITYKIKYQNDVEIEKTVISEVVLKEPVDKIVQVQTVTTSRSQTFRNTSSTSSNGTVKIFKVTA